MSELVSTARVIYIAATAALGGLLFGFDTAVINGTVTALRQQWPGSELALGSAVSSALVGCAVGALIAGRLADRYGRVRAMLVTSFLFIISSMGSGCAHSLLELGAWRALGGIAIGMASVIAPAYIAEIAPAHLRGRLGTLQQLAVVLGIAAALLGDYFIALYAGSAAAPAWLGYAAWRWMFWTNVLPAALYGIGALVLPESPRHLVARGRDQEALAVLRTTEGDLAEVRIAEIRATLNEERPARWSDLRATSGGILPIVWVGVVLSVFQQLVGINVIFYYSSALWQAVGFSEHDALLVTVITSVTNILTTMVAIATIDRFGRKPLLVAGSIGMAITLAVMAWVFSQSLVSATGVSATGVSATGVSATGALSLSPRDGRVALVAANAYVFCFGFSWGPVVWVMLGEMFSNRIRASALSLAAASQWVANAMVVATFPWLQKLGLGLAYGAYATAAFVSLLFVLRYIRETRNKTLEEM